MTPDLQAIADWLIGNGAEAVTIRFRDDQHRIRHCQFGPQDGRVVFVDLTDPSRRRTVGSTTDTGAGRQPATP